MLRIITLEEHYCDRDIAEASREMSLAMSPYFAAAYEPDKGYSYSPAPEQERNLGEERIRDMDRNGISMQVLSCLTAQNLPYGKAVSVVKEANNRLKEAISRYPDRLAAFASLPTSHPEEAAEELERCVKELGFVGAAICGRTNSGKEESGTDGCGFLDEPEYRPILSMAQSLDVPLYLHPAVPPITVQRACYDGLNPLVSARFSTSAWGWHQETAIHLLHMILAGVFDCYPHLNIIAGHWGEMIPFYLSRLDQALPRGITGLALDISGYFRRNVYITPSGMFDMNQLRYCVQVLGADRILYAVDYPFIGNEKAAGFLEDAPLSQEDKEKIAYKNAELLLKL